MNQWTCWNPWGKYRCTYSKINEYMTIYDNPRSMSFIDLRTRSLRFIIFELFFLKNTRPFETKFYMEPPMDVGMKIHSNVPGHMTKMASRPIHCKKCKNLQKSPSSEPRGWWPWNLVHNIGCSSTCTTKFVQMMTLGWPWPFLWHGQICFLMLLHGWKLI